MLVEDTSGSDSEGSAIGEFTLPSEQAIEDLLDTANKAPLIEQMGFRSYKEDHEEYNKRRKMAADALSAKPVQFIIGSAWKSVKTKATRQILIDKVKSALAEYNYSDSVCLAIIISLINNKRRNKNRKKNMDINLAGGTVKKGRPPTTGHYVGRRRTTSQGAITTTSKTVPSVHIETKKPGEASAPAYHGIVGAVRGQGAKVYNRGKQ